MTGCGNDSGSRSPEAMTQLVVVVTHPFSQPLGVQKLLTRKGTADRRYVTQGAKQTYMKCIGNCIDSDLPSSSSDFWTDQWRNKN